MEVFVGVRSRYHSVMPIPRNSRTRGGKRLLLVIGDIAEIMRVTGSDLELWIP